MMQLFQTLFSLCNLCPYMSDQYAIEKFSRALEVVPRTLAENAGLNATDVVGMSEYCPRRPGRKPGAFLYTRKRVSLSHGGQGESLMHPYTRGSACLSLANIARHVIQRIRNPRS